jgi:hypothetical protein
MAAIVGGKLGGAQGGCWQAGFAWFFAAALTALSPE